MRILKMFLLLCLVVFAGCSKEEESKESSLQVSAESVFNLNNGEHVLRISVKSASEWSVAGGTNWCKTEIVKGAESDSLIVKVSVNLLEEVRSAPLRISNLEENKEITISQAQGDGKYQYRLPVIFHILDNGSGTVNQLLPYQLVSMLKQINALYAGKNGNSVDMNIEFVAATEDPQGNPLEQAGINKVRHSQSKIDPESFITNKYGDNAWMWDLNKYVNVVVAELVKDINMGYSEFPLTPKSNPLEGLLSDDRYYAELPSDNFPCVILNTKAVDKINVIPGGEQNIGIITLAHELSHYLGVFHVFTGEGEFETDYCNDTPDYDRSAYLDWCDLNAYEPWATKTQRQDKQGNVFTSTNIMDYQEGYMDRFTSDQRKRMRHVLSYSPLIPGPKIAVKPEPSATKSGVRRMMGE